jgi:O-acetylserine/cysteine efflux transporter
MKWTDALLAALVPTLWGLGFTLSKAAFDTFPPILLIALRFSVTALAFTWAVPVPARPVLWRVFMISIVAGSVQYSMAYWGLAGMDAATASLVIQLEVPFAALIATVFLKERLGWNRAIGMAIAFVGIVLIAGEPRVQESWFPALLVAAAAFTWAIGQVMVRALGPVGGFTLIAWVAAFSAPQLFVASFIFESGQWTAMTSAGLPQWGLVLYLGLIMNGVGYALWYHLLGKYDVNRCIPFMLLVPVIGVGSAVLFLGESLTWLVALGGLVVISGVAVITFERRTFARRVR